MSHEQNQSKLKNIYTPHITKNEFKVGDIVTVNNSVTMFKIQSIRGSLVSLTQDIEGGENTVYNNVHTNHLHKVR